jgi:hypothetical protein
MSDQLDDVWDSRDLPVLREVCRAKQRERGAVDLEPISETLGISLDEVTAAALNLERGGLVELVRGFGVTDVKDVTGQALREVGLWPSPATAFDRLIAALESIAANTDEDEDTRTLYAKSSTVSPRSAARSASRSSRPLSAASYHREPATIGARYDPEQWW